MTPEEVMQQIEQENAQFVCLSFCDIYGVERNITVIPSELPRAMKNGIPLDASLVAGFKLDAKIDLLAFPDPYTLSDLPQSLADEELGSAVRMCANIFLPDGTRFENDPRAILEKAVKTEKLAGLIDLHAAFDGKHDQFVEDGIHPNQRGARTIAETVARTIDPDVKIEQRGFWMGR